MIAAIYARKSTEQNVTDDAKSVTRQVELARAFATEKKWDVIEEYIDDGVSGVASAKLVRRAAMLAAAAEGKFSVLIIRDLDRLSRNDEELPSLVYSLRDSGVEVWSYADRNRVDTRTAMSRGMLTMKATFAAAEREAAQERTREALRRKAAAGHVAGGRVLGYDNVRQGDGGPVVRVVNEAEAAIVRRIFEMAAEGKGLLKIARALNEAHVKNPTGQDRSKSTKRSDEWANTGIRAVLQRRLYLGEVVYGRRRNEYRHGRRIKIEAEQPITRQDESLRIVAYELWQAAHARMAATTVVHLRRHNGQLRGKPSSGLESRYLFSGFLRCGICGGNMIANATRGQRGRPQLRYICSVHKHRPGTCTNKYGVAVAALDDAVLAQLRHYLDLAVITDRLTALIAAPTAHIAERGETEALVADLNRKIKNLVDALEATGNDPEVAARLKDVRRQRDEAAARLEHLDGLTLNELPDFTTEAGRAAWAADIRPALADLRATLTSDPAKARQRLREVLSGTITVTPAVDDDGVRFDVQGVSSFEAVKVSLDDGSFHGKVTVTRPVAARVTRQTSVSGRYVVPPG